MSITMKEAGYILDAMAFAYASGVDDYTKLTVEEVEKKTRILFIEFCEQAGIDAIEEND